MVYMFMSDFTEWKMRQQMISRGQYKLLACLLTLLEMTGEESENEKKIVDMFTTTTLRQLLNFGYNMDKWDC